MKYLATIVRLLRLGARKVYLYGFVYTTLRQFFHIRKNLVLLESSLGREFEGNPYAIATYLAASEKYQKLDIVIVAPQKARRGLRRTLNRSGIRYVQAASLRYVYYLATAEYLINDVTFPQYFNRRRDQHYLNTWHGTPLKTLGRKIRTNTFEAFSNAQRNFLHATVLLVPNPHTEKVLVEDYMINDIWPGDLLRCDYPRNDVLFESTLSLEQDKSRNVAFMPTWRGDASQRERDSRTFLDELKVTLDNLDRELDQQITLWVRLHPFVIGSPDLSRYTRIKEFPDAVLAYDWLAKCDALITDYSSVMFDFAVTGRPIFLYIPDADSYDDNRGFCLDLKALPFPVFLHPSQLANAINHLPKRRDSVQATSNDSYAEFLSTFCPWRGRDNTKIVCEAFFEANKGGRRIPAVRSGKKSILIFVGPLLRNGIVSSFKALIQQLDTQKYDITIMAASGADNTHAEQYFRNIRSGVRYIPYRFRMWFTAAQMLQIFWIYVFSRRWSYNLTALTSIWHGEFRRITGDATFDVYIDFNGYSWRSTMLGLGSHCNRVVYVHNEMVKEMEAGKIVDRRILLLSYEAASRVAVVRNGIEREFCHKYFDYSNKVSYVPNVLSLNVEEGAAQPLRSAFSDITEESEFLRVQRALSLPHVFRFVNVGRFSHEKGQLRLIEAFEAVHDSIPRTQLFIVGGYGRIYADVLARAQASVARNSIFVLVGSNNPFPLIRCADAFVLSSTYEGLPVVFFEMLQLDIPIVSTRIPGPAEFLDKGYGLLVDDSTDGLVQGMHVAFQRKIPKRKFDFAAYNKLALEAFDNLIESACDKEAVPVRESIKFDQPAAPASLSINGDLRSSSTLSDHVSHKRK